MQEEIHELKDLKEKHEAELEKLRQEIKDKEVENKIAGKKGDHLVSAYPVHNFIFFHTLSQTMIFIFDTLCQT